MVYGVRGGYYESGVDRASVFWRPARSGMVEQSAFFCAVVNRSSPSPRHASAYFHSSCLVSHMSCTWRFAFSVGKCSLPTPIWVIDSCLLYIYLKLLSLPTILLLRLGPHIIQAQSIIENKRKGNYRYTSCPSSQALTPKLPKENP